MANATDSIPALEWLTYDLPNISATLQYLSSQVRQGVPPLQSPQAKTASGFENTTEKENGNLPLFRAQHFPQFRTHRHRSRSLPNRD